MRRQRRGQQHRCFSLCWNQASLLRWTLSWTVRDFRLIQGPGGDSVLLLLCLMAVPLRFSFLVFTGSPWTLFADFRLITWFWPLSVFDLWLCCSSIKSLNQSWSVYRDWWHEKVNPSPPLVAIIPNLLMVWKLSALQAWTFESTLLKLWHFRSIWTRSRHWTGSTNPQTQHKGERHSICVCETEKVCLCLRGPAGLPFLINSGFVWGRRSERYFLM